MSAMQASAIALRLAKRCMLDAQPFAVFAGALAIDAELERIIHEDEMDRDLTDPTVAKNYVLSLSAEVVSKAHTIEILRAKCLRHGEEQARELDRQAQMHKAEVGKLNDRIEELTGTIDGLENQILAWREHQ
jgi:hypothetical protein